MSTTEPEYGVCWGLGGVQWLYEVVDGEQSPIGPVHSLLDASAQGDALRCACDLILTDDFGQWANDFQRGRWAAAAEIRGASRSRVSLQERTDQ